MSAPDDLRWGLPRGPSADPDRDVDDEIAFHMEARVEDNLRRGMSPEAARAEAQTRFGGVARVRRELLELAHRGVVRRRRRDAVLDLGRDVRWAARSLRRRPGFAAVAVLTLALGIGGTTAVFSLTNTLLLQPPPGVTEPDSLIRLQLVIHFPGNEGTAIIAHPYYLDLEHAAPALSSLAGVMGSAVQVGFPGARDPLPRRLVAEMVTGNYASTLGLRARIGRLPGAGDAQNPRVAAISERLWKNAYDRAPAAVGSTILLNGASYTVIGVIAGAYRGQSMGSDSDLLIPVEAYADAGSGFLMLARGRADPLHDRGLGVWNVMIGRLATGATPKEAEAELRVAWDRILEANPLHVGGPITPPGGNPFAHPIPTVIPGLALLSLPYLQKLTETFALLAGAVTLLLLLACANAANLLLVRGHARRGELAIMRAIGAGRGQLVRQLMLEALLLSLAGGVAGLAVALGAFRLFRGERVLQWMPALESVRISGAVLFFAFVSSLLAAAMSGILPSILSVRHLGWISSGASGSQVRGRTSRGLLVLQVALSFVLVVGAGLLLDTLRALRSTRLGVDPESVLEASIDPTTQHYDSVRSAELYRSVLSAASALPDVAVAGLARWPVLGGSRGGILARPEGAARDDPRALRSALSNVVSPGFLQAVGLQLIAGRDFQADEMDPAPGQMGVAILTAGAATRLFPDRDAVGQRIDLGGSAPRIVEVVGVVADARLLSVKEGEGLWVIEPLGQRPVQWATLYLRGRRGAPSPRELDALMARLDPAMPLYDLQPLSKRIDQNLGLERVLARTTGLFATLALLLAGVGIYAVMSTVVQGRTRELGVRVALGADRDSVRSMILRDGVQVAVVGVVIGALASTQLVGLLQRRLWGVQPLDPTVFLASAGTLLVAAAAACWAPAWRATRIDPVTALRTD